MDSQETDRKLREVFYRNEPSFARSEADLVTQTANSGHAGRGGSRRVLRLVTITVAVLVVGIGVAAGVWQAIVHIGSNNPIVLITDQTMSPGPTGATTPGLSRDEIQAVTFRNLAAGTSRDATDAEIDHFIEYYSKADRFSDDVGTTHPALIEVLLKSGATLSVWGGAEGFQTVGLSHKQYTQYNIKGAELGRLLEQIATDTMSPPLTAPVTVSTPAATTTTATATIVTIDSGTHTSITIWDAPSTTDGDTHSSITIAYPESTTTIPHSAPTTQVPQVPDPDPGTWPSTTDIHDSS